ncbi:hypothetical protein [Ruminococcus sp.]|uniref:hypothetical protein n=1 Tax=Ruminococcus sp. TaxID=41978 RepID=UPI00388FB60D
MNLQRNTDYALRIIICILKLCSNKTVYKNGISMYNICIQTGVQKITASRICESLYHKDLLIMSVPKDGSASCYLPSKKLEKLTLLELIEIIEGNTNIFTLFNSEHKFIKPNKSLLFDINSRINTHLIQVNMKDFTR